jgi:putative polyketide hydroxylase
MRRASAARRHQKKLGIDLEVHRVGADGLTDPNGGFLSSFGIDPTGTVLGRPDGFVAWRAKTGEDASAAKMESALSTILSRYPGVCSLARLRP